MKPLRAALSLIAFISLGLVTLTTSASANSFYSPEIDFRDRHIWSDANWEESYTGSQAGVTVTLDPHPESAKLWWDRKDGMGIRHSYEDDEIEENERMRVYFQGGADLSAIYISDLFYEDGYYEKGYYRIDGGEWVSFDASTLPGSNDNGERIIEFDTPLPNVLRVDFKAPGRIGREDHDYALMGFDLQATQIPEPGTALLMGAGLCLISARSRRR